MTRVIDLHTHSTFSDGELTPEMLVVSAKMAAVDVLALTDHDTIDGIERASIKAKELGIHLITGTEMTVRWLSKELHILGLNFDPTTAVLANGLKQQQVARMDRAKRIGESLSSAGIHGTMAGAQSIAQSELVARPHFAHYLVQIGRAKDVSDAFKKYLTPGRPGYVETEWVDLSSAVHWIKQAGGLSVIAHPARYKLTMSRLRKLVTVFKEDGGDGMEVITSSQSLDEANIMARLCVEYDLLASCGSDFHGHNMRGKLGAMAAIPQGARAIWEKFTA